MSIAPSVARLAAQTHESITITFEAEYRPPTPGSSAWSIIAKNIRLGLVVPTERPLPNSVLAKMLARSSDPNPYALIDQYIVFQGVTDRDFGGEAPFPVILKQARVVRYNPTSKDLNSPISTAFLTKTL